MQKISDQHLDANSDRSVRATAPVAGIGTNATGASNYGTGIVGTVGTVGYTMATGSSVKGATTWHPQAANDSIKIPLIECKLQYMMDIDDGDISFAVFSAERGQELTCLFEPENDITVKEHMKISLLMLLMMQGDFVAHEEPMQFIRKHHLERHFKMSVEL